MSRFGDHLWNGSQVGLVTRWPFLQFMPHFVRAFPLDMDNTGLKILKMTGWPHTSIRSHIYEGCLLRFHLPTVRHFWLKSSVLNPGSLSHPWSLEHSSNCLCSPPSAEAYYHLFSWSSGLLSFLPTYVVLPLSTSSSTVLPVFCPLSASSDYFVPPSNWD